MRKHLLFWGAAVLCLACGGSNGNPLQDAGGTDGTQADTGSADADVTDDTGVDPGDAAPPCDNLECQIINCGTMDGTTITGTVYDPSGQRTIYNAFVYIPNRPLDPIPPGVTCTSCMAPASGKPLVSAVTGANGTFKLTNVPAGANIPIVVQVGKWRHKDVLAMVPQCANSVAPKTTTMLPKKQPMMGTDDNLPQIAVQTGCDWTECFLQRTVGIDASEFGAPGTKARVHVYRGKDDNQVFPFTPTDAYAFWGNVADLKKYDILVNSCECSPYDRTQGGQYPNAYTNMKTYLESGGRMFGTHFHYNWFAPSTGPTDFQTQAPWLSGGSGSPPFSVDDSSPRGKAFADWLQSNNVTQQLGQINLIDTRNSVAGLNGGMKGSGTYKNTTQWIFHPQNQTLYLSFNAPTAKLPKDQCGRAMFSDVHTSGDAFNAGTFPQSCTALGNAHDLDEHALEFLFFDLAGCVQDDTKAPITPPTQ